MNFFAQNLRVFKTSFWPLFALVVISSSVDHFLTFEVEKAMTHPQGVQPEIFVFGSLSVILGLLFPVLISLTAIYGILRSKNQNLEVGDFFAKFSSQTFIENLRSWGKILTWGLLLILPGVWKVLQYCFVTFVVTCSKAYDDGNVDALQYSAKVFKKHKLKTLGIMFLFTILIPIIMTTLFDGYKLLWKTPIASLFLSAVNVYFIIISTQLLFNIFSSEEPKNESYI
ncbi:hypothetical protein BDW_06620 [Bdellovibrio bacteriovorus W]|nr:hypothetical protein BDW_06620 [Bdellovibrio bacteriovorus W]